ncbi:MAG TPA: hypothetical protein VNV66_08490 [Pilimelia sp.]|nr:hypothetical protein [Pilimelia sp.]
MTQAYRSGDDVLVLADDGTEAQLVGHDWATLRPRWRFLGPVSLLGRCGPWFCVDGGESTAAVNPATGQVRRRRPGLPAVLGQPLVLPG